MPLAAPHLAQHLVLTNKQTRIATTLDADLQAAAQRLAVQERAYLGDGADLALVVVENRSRNVIAYVGGSDYWGKAGQVDLAARARSPGSALKPFIYGLAFDNLILHPSSRMEDAPTQFGDYAPRDFDGGFQGAVTARDALRMSLNIPAVTVLDRVGAARLHAFAAECGRQTCVSHPRRAQPAGGAGRAWHLARRHHHAL